MPFSWVCEGTASYVTMRIIINADDFGRNAETNAKIIGLARERKITSVSLIANAPAIEEAVAALQKCPDISTGIHLNLTEFCPLTPSEKLGSLKECTTEVGAFRGEDFLRKKAITPDLLDAIFFELKMQVEVLLARGVQLSHFDSHNHVHTIPRLFFVIKKLQQHFGIRKVRTTWTIFRPGNEPTLTCRLKKKTWDVALRYYYKTITTEAFTSLVDFIEAASWRKLPFQSVEIMVHPGHPDFDYETRILDTNWRERILCSTELINYTDL